MLEGGSSVLPQGKMMSAVKAAGAFTGQVEQIRGITGAAAVDENMP